MKHRYPEELLAERKYPNLRRRTDVIEFDFTKADGQPVNRLAFGRTERFGYYAYPDQPNQAVGTPVLEPWILSVSAKVAYYNAGGDLLGLTDFGGLRLLASFVEYDLVESLGNLDVTDLATLANQERAQDIGAIEFQTAGTPLGRRFYGSNATSDGYPVPRQELPDSRCQYPRTYYWPLLLYAELDTTNTFGTNPTGGLPDAYAFRGTFVVDSEWRERGA